MEQKERRRARRKEVAVPPNASNRRGKQTQGKGKHPSEKEEGRGSCRGDYKVSGRTVYRRMGQRMIGKETNKKSVTVRRSMIGEQKGRRRQEKQKEMIGNRRREGFKERRRARRKKVALPPNTPNRRCSARVEPAGTGANTCHSKELLAWMNHLFNFDDVHLKVCIETWSHYKI